ncbi:fimbria/pilus outer membrane usher protein [Ancylobacter oerskovii]|uniref:Fimbria/pilus outer membrane usher protein n=1 Tax=Ancylobacter oerskovii TaxID=459519 RepID=A0ABW4Z200_9HYPH|nr:fimbria/pilus outer membrane usher protein [Ancylobacter oerskovii]MBS7544860.1 fimbrial biogenesis outer membrane usher protein [Ancylobacter oerskovii]
MLCVHQGLAHAAAPEVAPAPDDTGAAAAGPALDLQLEVFVNGVTTGLIGSFRQEADGTLSVDPKELSELGIRPQRAALGADGRVRLDRMSGASFRYDAASQSLQVEAPDALRIPRNVDARGDPVARADPESDWGVVSNYTLFANFQNEEFFSIPDYQGTSATLDNTLFSPFGNLNYSFIANTGASEYGAPDFLRLNTSWTYFDARNLATYTAGDLVSGGLLWTRPVRLGGVQIRRNFGLRPDLVTLPIPSLAGSAAVPSTVEVFVNGQRTLDKQLPSGPFQVTNLPIVAGPGQARLVLTESSGRQIVADVPFYVSTQLLAEGLVDYSLEAGYARNYYGIYSDVYYSDPVGSGTIRYGLSNQLTIEAHAEGGAGLVNGGFGGAFNLASYGVMSLAGAASVLDDRSGYQIAGSIEFAIDSWRVSLRSQRTFGDYQDIASVTAEGQELPTPFSVAPLFNALPPRAIDQLSISTPLADRASLNLNFTNYEQIDGSNYRIAGISYARPLFNGNLFVNGFMDFANAGSYGATLGFSVPLGPQSSGALSADVDAQGASIAAQAMKSEGLEPGSYGWRFLDSEGAQTYRGVAGSYRGQNGRVEVGVQQYGSGGNAFTATAQGAIVAAGGGVFFSNQISDSFGVVDVGAPGVPVRAQNHMVGVTDAGGKVLVPNLQSYEENAIEIDPTNLPVDAQIANTRRTVVPAARSGVLVKFGVKSGGASALVAFIDAKGVALPMGTLVALNGSPQPVVVGYDGQAFLGDLQPSNSATITLPDGNSCAASFDFTPRPGRQVVIEKVPCQ